MLREIEVGCDVRTRRTIFALYDRDTGEAVRCVMCRCLVTYQMAESGHTHSNRCSCGVTHDAR